MITQANINKTTTAMKDIKRCPWDKYIFELFSGQNVMANSTGKLPLYIILTCLEMLRGPAYMSDLPLYVTRPYMYICWR